jgi:hypothetical protein
MAAVPLSWISTKQFSILQRWSPVSSASFATKVRCRCGMQYSAAMTVAGCYVPFHRYRCGGNENAGGYDRSKLPVIAP